MKDLEKIKEFFSESSDNSIKPGDIVKSKIYYYKDKTGKVKSIKGDIAVVDFGDGKPVDHELRRLVKDRAMTAAYEAKEEYFKPMIRKDKSYPNFLYVDIAYPAGSDVLSIGGDKTMSGQDREAGAAKALAMGNAVAKKLQAKYNIEDIEVNDLKNGKVQVFAVSDDFTKMSSPSLDEAKKETGVDMAKKQLDALGVKYEMSTTDKVRPFKVIYQPINKSDEFYDKFEDIVDLFNLKGVVKSSMNENFPGPGEIVDAKYLNNAMLDYFNRMNIKLLINTKTKKGIKGGVGTMYGDLVFNGDDIKLKDIVSVEIIESSMNEAQEGESLYKDWDQFEKPSKIKVYLNNGKTLEISPLKLKGGKRVYDAVLQAFIDDRFDITNKVIQGMMNNLSEAKEEDKTFLIQQAKDKYNKLQQAFLKIENPSDLLVKQLEKAEQKYKDLIKSTISEAKEEDAVDTITMDVPLFIRMLEYSREDAAEDMDLHDVTEKAISLGKERGILQMDDYDEIIGTTEKVNEVNLKQAKLSSAEYQKAKKLKDFKASDWKWNADEDLYTKVVKEGMGGQLDEPYFIEVSVRDARKALDLFQDQYRKSNIEMYGSNVYAANTPEDIYDLYYDLTSQDIEILDSSNFEEDLDEAKHKEKGIEKRISEALDKINEELCPAGKAYRKRRIAAGEKSSAYLSGRAVKVCKGQMSGKKKKK